MLNFIEPLRCALLSHHNVNQHFDLAEELGFLFDMLDQAFGGMLQVCFVCVKITFECKLVAIYLTVRC